LKMKYTIKLIFIAFAFSVILYGCYNDSEEYLYPNITNNCDTSNVTFTANINAINTENCLNCHQGSGAGGGIDLNGYANIKIQVDNGKYIGTIKQLPGYSPMPKGGNKLSDCKINQIDIWIRNGALNN